MAFMKGRFFQKRNIRKGRPCAEKPSVLRKFGQFNRAPAGKSSHMGIYVGASCKVKRSPMKHLVNRFLFITARYASVCLALTLGLLALFLVGTSYVLCSKSKFSIY